MEQWQWAIMAQNGVNGRFTSFARELQMYTAVYDVVYGVARWGRREIVRFQKETV